MLLVVVEHFLLLQRLAVINRSAAPLEICMSGLWAVYKKKKKQKKIKKKIIKIRKKIRIKIRKK